MGKIRYKDYVIEFSNVSLNYCLYKEVKYQKIGTGTKENPNGEMNERLDALAYDMPMQHIIKKIIALETEATTEDVQTLETFLEQYKAAWKEIKEFFKNSLTTV